MNLGSEVTSSYGSPTIYYTLTLTSQSRPSNTRMTYNFKIHTRMGGKIGTGKELRGNVWGTNGSNYVTIKPSDESLNTWASGYTKDSYVSVTVDSSTGNASQTLYFSVTRPDGTGNGGSLNTQSFTVTSSALLYSKTTAPTTVTSASIVKPSTDFTVSWSGAAAGTNNAITGYTLYYTTDGSTPTTSSSSYTITTTETSGSKTITSGTDTDRGLVYKFKVVTNGTVSGYNSDISSSSTSTQINRLPSLSSATINNNNIPYNNGNGATRSYTVVANTDSDTGQSVTLCYATSLTGTKTKFTSPLSVPIKGTAGSTVTYYFWAYDGLEYSSALTVSAYINSLPTIDSMTVTSSGLQNSSNKYLTKTLNGSVVATKGSRASSITSYNWYYSLTSSSTPVLFNSTNSFTNINMRNLISANTAFGIGVQVVDSLGDTSAIKWSNYNTATSTSFVNPFTTAKDTPTVTITNIYNSDSASNVANTTAGNFYKKMYVAFTQPSGITNANGYFTISSYSLLINGTLIKTSSGTSNSYISVNNLNYDPGVTFTVTIRTNDSVNSINDVSTSVLPGTSTQLIECGPPTFPSSTIMSFAPASPYRVYITDVATDTLTITLDTLPTNRYNNGINLTAVLTENITNNVICSLNFRPRDSQYTATISRSDLQSAFETKFGSYINTDYPSTISVTTSNNFGQIGNIVSGDITFQFREAPIMDATLSTQVTYYAQSTAVTLSNSNPIINTGDIIHLILESPASGVSPATDRNNNITGYQVYLNRTTTNTRPTTGFTLYRTVSYENNTQTKTIDIEMPQYTDSQFLWFRVNAIDANGFVSESLATTNTILGCRVQNPIIQLDSITTNNDYQIEGTWKLLDLGGNNRDYDVYPNLERFGYPSGYTNVRARPIIKIQYSNNITFENCITTGNLNLDTTGSGLTSFTDYLDSQSLSDLIRYVLPTTSRGQNLFMRLIVALPTSTVLDSSSSAPTGQIKPTANTDITPDDLVNGSPLLSYIVSYSNIVVYYDVAPTVAYRQNFLGINSEQFTTNDQSRSANTTVLLINDYGNHRFIHFNGQLEEGLTVTPHTALVDLKTGQIDGFIISGGTWGST